MPFAAAVAVFLLPTQNHCTTGVAAAVVAAVANSFMFN